MPLKEKLPNQIMYLALISCEDVMGANGLNAILNYAKLQKFIGNHPPNNLELEQSSEDFTKFLSGMIGVLGEKGSKTITYQIGKKSFDIIREQFPSLLNIEGVELEDRTPDRLFGEYVRIQGIMFEAAKAIFGDIYNYYEDDRGFVSELSPCYWCKGLKTQTPICNAGTGFAAAIAKWIIGNDVKIEETHCIAAGDEKCIHVTYRP